MRGGWRASYPRNDGATPISRPKPQRTEINRCRDGFFALICAGTLRDPYHSLKLSHLLIDRLELRPEISEIILATIHRQHGLCELILQLARPHVEVIFNSFDDRIQGRTFIQATSQIGQVCAESFLQLRRLLTLVDHQCMRTMG